MISGLYNLKHSLFSIYPC